ncbi:serine/threonine-protein kinase [Sorangium sp. So ce1036]|uniref:serine/threonine-protein kinase n=1 Tax=Sorangium sp. So ce1036 TaxID=3133328 RepID=UPI003F071CE3
MSTPPPPAPAPPTPAAGDAAAVDAAAALVDTVISDRYRIVELVATGGMGAVYKAEHLLLRKWLAVKILLPAAKGSPELTARFEREAIAGAHIQHPNIASATDFGTLPDGSRFLVLEYVRGTTLDRIIKKGPVPAARAAEIARQIAAALAAAHERGVIHRDLKPRNIMIEQGTDAVKLIDFGFAKVPLERLSTTTDAPFGEARAEPVRITLSGIVFGTLAYMAPEAAQGMESVDERSDLYALGIILYEMLAGKRPFEAIVPVELFHEQCTATPPPLRLRAPGVLVSRELEAVVMRLLRKEPEARYPSARALLAALDAAMPTAEALGLLPWKDPLGGLGSALPFGNALPPRHDPARAPEPPEAPAWPAPARPAPAARPGAAEVAGPAAVGPAAAGGEPAGEMRGPGARGVPGQGGEARGPGARRAPRPRRRLAGWLLGAAAVAAGGALAAQLLGRLPAGAPGPAATGPELRGAAAAMQASPRDGARAPGDPTMPAQATPAAAPGVRAPTPEPLASAAAPGASAPAPEPLASAAAPGASAPTPELVASAAAPASSGAPVAPGPSAGAGLPAERGRLVEAVNAKRWKQAEDALLVLIEQDHAAFKERDVMMAAAAAAVKTAYRADDRADAIFDALENRLGPDGLDVAYEMVSGYGGTRGGKRAAALLRRPEVLKRASAPLRIAVELREAPCRRKDALFERAALEGDARALVFLDMLRSSQCQPRIGQCCFHRHAGIDRAVRVLRDRLRN